MTHGRPMRHRNPFASRPHTFTPPFPTDRVASGFRPNSRNPSCQSSHLVPPGSGPLNDEGSDRGRRWTGEVDYPTHPYGFYGSSYTSGCFYT